MDWLKALDRVVDMLELGLLGSFGAIANYLYVTVMQGKPFVWIMFFANIIIAFFAGNLVGEFIHPANEYRDGIIMASGYCAFPLLAMVEVKFREFVGKFGS